MSWSSTVEALKDAIYYKKEIRKADKEYAKKQKELKKQNKNK